MFRGAMESGQNVTLTAIIRRGQQLPVTERGPRAFSYAEHWAAAALRFVCGDYLAGTPRRWCLMD